MAVCIVCGKKDENCICEACKQVTDIKELCDSISKYFPGRGEMPLWDQIASEMSYGYNFKDVRFALADLLPSPEREYMKIVVASGNNSYMAKSSRPWLYELSEKCLGMDGLSEWQKNRVRSLVCDSLFKDYRFLEADEQAEMLIREEELPRQTYVSLTDFYIKTRRYEKVKNFLENALSREPEQSKTAFVINQQIREVENAIKKAKDGKGGYLPAPKEDKEEIQKKYLDFLAAIGVEVKDQPQPSSSGSSKKRAAIPKDQYPAPIETRDPDFKTFVAFDLETTGRSPGTDVIIEIGAVKVVDGVVQETGKFVFQELVKPYKKRIPDDVVALTGITNEEVKSARQMWEVTPDFLDFAGDNVLVGFNCVTFDSKFLVRAGRYSNRIITNPYFDVMRYAGDLKDKIGLTSKKVSLQELSEKLGIENPQAHRALADAVTTARVFLKLREMDGGGGSASIDDMLDDIDSW